MKSTIGRPRRLTDAQVAMILAWHEQILALKALRATVKTQRQLALELGVVELPLSDRTSNGLLKTANKFAG
jgi:hypothetical protein